MKKNTAAHSLFAERQAGFTLVELMIVIVLFVMLTSGAVLSYRSFYQRQQVLQSAKNVQEAMRFAQKKSRVGEKPPGCQTLNGYIVRGNSSSPTITLTADCTNADYTVTTVSLVGNARLVSNLNTTFLVITGGVINPDMVSVAYGSYMYTFEVNEGGEITDGDFEQR
jgi:prepilin-type N-terminal cleavage/methylation domain-containing protein